MTLATNQRVWLLALAVMLPLHGASAAGSGPVAQAGPVEVTLGQHGGKITLIETEAGGFTFNGQPFEGGEVTAENGNVYVLTLTDGVWIATYQPVEMLLQLGLSGESVTVTRAEDGSFWISLDEGRTLKSANGNEYALTMAGGDWVATYVAQTQDIPIGLSGQTWTVTQQEDGTWTGVHPVLGQQTLMPGAALAFGTDTYTLTLGQDGSWALTFVPLTVTVPLGLSGQTAILSKGETGGWTLAGEPFASGDRVDAGAGQYTLVLGANDTWVAVFNQTVTPVALGSSGTIVVLTLQEDGTYTRDGAPFASGTVVTAANGQEYTVLLQDGTWAATFSAGATPIQGTGLTAIPSETGTGYVVNGQPLPASGRGDIDVDGALYHVWPTEDGGLAGARFDADIDTDTDYARGGIEAGDFRLSRDNSTTVANESRTKLEVLGVEFPIGDLLDNGSASVQGDSLVGQALERLQKARSDAQALMQVYTSGSDLLARELERIWTVTAQEAVDTIFGADGDSSVVDLGTTPAERDYLEALDERIEALGSETSFAAATEQNGGGVFQDAELSSAAARDTFGAVDSEATAAFGATGDTRYGAVVARTRDVAAADLADGTSGVLAYATIEPTQRLRNVTTQGNAFYEGGTAAIGEDGTLYNGDISLRVRFSTNTVSGLVSNIRTTDGQVWRHLYGDVDRVILPDATVQSDATWDSAADTKSDTAELTYVPRLGSPVSIQTTGEFTGRLLGTGSDSGSQAVGLWALKESSGSADDLISGGFGAIRTADEPVERPDLDDGSGVEAMVTGESTGIDDGNLEVTVLDWDWVGAAFEIKRDDSNNQLTRTIEVALTELFDRSGEETVIYGERHVEIARERITKLRSDLATLIQLDLLPDTQQPDLWKEVQTIVGTRIFNKGPDDNGDLILPPGLDEEYDADEALGLIDQVLAALASRGALDDALDDGIFAGDGGDYVTRGAGDIWDERVSETRVLMRSTDYTRFGAWWQRLSRDALRSGDWLDNQGGGPDVYAYSPLEPTVVRSAASPSFPAGGTAQYEGGTVAVQGTKIYSGEVGITAAWSESFAREADPRGELTVVISGLQDNETGDPLTFFASDSVFGDLDTVIITEIAVTGNSDSQLVFDDASTGSGLTLRPGDLRRSDARPTDVTTEVSGLFVGDSVDGPVAVIGSWSLATGAGATTIIGSGDEIKGAFGAELP